MLMHLATKLVVKEHRLRYQKEQFDRFFMSQTFPEFSKDDITMGDYAKEYSRLVSQLIESSHNYKSPKIEANYDDFSEQRIKPLNATIFYYFFGTNRAGKSWAQWMLSSARYPNDKFRRAYMRFFA